MRVELSHRNHCPDHSPTSFKGLTTKRLTVGGQEGVHGRGMVDHEVTSYRAIPLWIFIGVDFSVLIRCGVDFTIVTL